jgi:hypothetical protein
MPNIHDHHQGRPVRALKTRTLALAADFPGWGSPGYEDFLVPIPEGAHGVVDHVESHGSNPWTRYTIRFADGTRASGLCLGSDIEFASAHSS